MQFYCFINRIIFCVVFLLHCLHGSGALDLRITQKELGSDFRGEFNRSAYWSWDISNFATVELNDRYTFSGGITLGTVEKDFEFKLYTAAGIAPLSWINLLSGIPFTVHLAYIYYTLPGLSFDVHTNSVFPYAAYNGKWAGLAIGPNFRFTRILDGPPVYESMLSFRVYANFVNREKFRIGLSLGNFNDLYMANMGAISMSFDSLIHITEQWSVFNALELYQSGIDGLTTAFYGIAYRGGARYAW